ncbi:MAG: DUF4833 domain-containing protein [Elusimicrobiota bacterium]|jgi:hypothetical protein|nr:DUF4833 domain-containing protein [Elusimicrobiota bacterium]
MKKLMLFALSFAVLTFAASLAFADQKNLFHIERNKNANIVVYDVVLNPDGTINSKNPIDAYWKLLAKDGSRAELGMLDKRAYGFSVTDLGEGAYELRLKAVEGKPIKVTLVNGEPKGILKINDRDAYLNKVYVFASGISVKYYTLTGTDVSTGQTIEEKVDND